MFGPRITEHQWRMLERLEENGKEVAPHPRPSVAHAMWLRTACALAEKGLVRLDLVEEEGWSVELL